MKIKDYFGEGQTIIIDATSIQVFLPVLSEEGGHGAGEDLALIVDVLEDVLGPLHHVPDLGARRRPVHVPDHLLLHLLPQHILEKKYNIKRCKSFTMNSGSWVRAG